MTTINDYEVVMLALVAWREARSESNAVMCEVMATVRNRVLNPKWWGRDYISVITKKWQYSSIAAPNDPQLIIYPQKDDMIFQTLLNRAMDVKSGNYKQIMKGADSYYDDSIDPPEWATEDKRVGKLDRLTFYNIDGDTDD